MARDCYRTLIFVLLFGCLTWLAVTLVHADGRVFLLESKNGTAADDGVVAQALCGAHGARLASVSELRRAVVECSFSACTRGWVAGPTIGTMVCSDMGGGQQAVRTLDVKVENGSVDNSHLDIFCVKDQGGPCGDPPSFPNTNLQEHVNIEMGDELLYSCVPGFIMSSGRSAFSLLCDSCGEWYGQVELCVKDTTETHIDYEDQFPEGGHVAFEDMEEGEDGHVKTKELEPDSEQDQDQDQGSRLGEEMSTAEEEQAEGGVDGTREAEEGKVEEDEPDVEDSTERGSQQPTGTTETPVSLLSQKHLFWFPSETFHQQERAEGTGAPAWDLIPGSESIGVKASGSDAGDLLISPPTREPLNDTREGGGESVASTDEFWLDGHPVTQESWEEDAEDGERLAGGSSETGIEKEGGAHRVTDRPNEVEISRPDVSSTAPSPSVTEAVAPLTRPADYGVKLIPVGPKPTSAPEIISTSVEDVGSEAFTNRSLVARAHTVTPAPLPAAPTSEFHPLDNAVTAGPTAPWETTESLDPFLDHIPGPTEQEDVTAPYQEDPRDIGPSSPDDLAGSDEPDLPTERNLTHLRAEKTPTEEPCAGEGCPQASRGTTVAVAIAAVCALAVTAAVSVWCYKKRQQKSSVYKMNGKGQTRHPQQMEMQQKV